MSRDQTIEQLSFFLCPSILVNIKIFSVGTITNIRFEHAIKNNLIGRVMLWRSNSFCWEQHLPLYEPFLGKLIGNQITKSHFAKKTLRLSCVYLQNQINQCAHEKQVFHNCFCMRDKMWMLSLLQNFACFWAQHICEEAVHELLLKTDIYFTFL